MNKYLMTAAALAFSASAYANDHKNFSGFALGMNLGYGLGSSTALTGGTGAAAGAVATGVSQKNNLALKGVNGGLFLTYGWMFQKDLYVGLEAYGKISSLEGRQSFKLAAVGVSADEQKYISSVKAKNTNSFGAALRLGSVVHNGVLAYAKVGLESANWKFEQNFDSRLAGAATSTLLTNTKSKRLTGIPFGLGAEVVKGRWVWGAEVVRTHYTTTTAVNSVQGTGATQQTLTTKFRPSKMELNLRVAYKF